MNFIKSHYLPLVLTLAGFIFTIYCFFPGYMSSDSIDQLTQAREVIYSDWHPPIMAALWSVFDKVYPGPAGMLVFHNTLFWSGVFIICILYIPNRLLAGITILLIGFFPPIFSHLGIIWKDVGLGASLAFSLGLMLLGWKNGKIWPLIFAIPMLFYGFAVRHNGPIAVMPLLFLFSFILIKIGGVSEHRERFYVFIFALLFFFVFRVSNVILNDFLNQGERSYTVQGGLIYDLVAISVFKNEVLLPSYLNIPQPDNRWTIDDLKKVFDPESCCLLFWGDSQTKRIKLSHNPNEVYALSKYWIAQIGNNFKPYLLHRWHLFKRQLGLQGSNVCYPYCIGIEKNYLGITFTPNRLNTVVQNILEAVKNSFFFRTWIFLLAGIIIFGIGGAHRSLEVCLISASGIIFIMTGSVISPACDFRYNWWGIISIPLSAIILFKGKPNKEMR